MTTSSEARDIATKVRRGEVLDDAEISKLADFVEQSTGSQLHCIREGEVVLPRAWYYMSADGNWYLRFDRSLAQAVHTVGMPMHRATIVATLGQRNLAEHILSSPTVESDWDARWARALLEGYERATTQ